MTKKRGELRPKRVELALKRGISTQNGGNLPPKGGIYTEERGVDAEKWELAPKSRNTLQKKGDYRKKGGLTAKIGGFIPEMEEFYQNKGN